MKSDRFTMTVNLPAANKGNNRRLPPHAPVKAHLCDEYHCPPNWIESSGRMASYFIEVQKDKAMWLDFTNNQHDSHDVAVVISVQGINTITGMPQGNPQLEQYLDSCPKCKTAFQANRFCASCGYKWPKQNYLSSTSGKTMWIDGFRAIDGVIRQYVFTEETAKGVAAGIIGDQRVYAIGVAFFTSKNPKPKPAYTPIRGLNMLADYGNLSMSMTKSASPTVFTKGTSSSKGAGGASAGDSSVCRSKPHLEYIQNNYLSLDSVTAEPTCLVSQDSCEVTNDWHSASENPRSLVQAKLEVGAGNEIDQEIGDDPNTLDYWNAEPSALICVNYCGPLEAANILAQKKEIQKAAQGFLTRIPVTN